MTSNPYIHPVAHPELIDKSVDQVKSILSPDEAAAYLTPFVHPELEGYLLDNAGSDGTPVRVVVLRGTIHEPDGTPRRAGETMIMPKYVADTWIKEGRLELA